MALLRSYSNFGDSVIDEDERIIGTGAFESVFYVVIVESRGEVE